MGKKSGGEEEGGGESVGLWYVSFSDMITLLLSFFVILTSFSSFSKESLDKFSGACAYIANYSILPSRHISQDSLAPVKKYMDWTQQGSEKTPNEYELTNITKPKASEWLAGMSAAYHNRRVFCLPSSGLFWGKGASLIPAGKGHLDLMASYLKMMPCQVTIAQSSIDGDASAGVDRAWAILEYWTTRGLKQEHMAIAAIDSAAARGAGQSVIEITVTAGGAP